MFASEKKRELKGPNAQVFDLKRALILLPNDLPGGAERVTMTVAEAALKSGYFKEVVVFVMSRGDNGRLAPLACYSTAKLVFAKTQRQRGGLLDLLRIFREGPYDFVFSSFLDINALANIALRLGVLKARRLVTRESTMFFDRDFGLKTVVVRALYRFYGSQHLIVCQTERMAQSLNKNTLRKFAHLIRTIPNPLPFSIADRISSPAFTRSFVQEDRIAWCGRIAGIKSPQRAIETLAFLHELGRTNATLVMIGDGPLRAEVESLSRQLGLGRHVDFTGFVDHPYNVMRTCRAGLITSDLEGFPNVILEMLSSGIIGVASTDCAGELDRMPGLVVAREKTPQCLALALDKILRGNAAPPEILDFLLDRLPHKFLVSIM
jgi:glycosyltransferase involved in cell wall biosynthesis